MTGGTLRREGGRIGLLYASLGAIIGSGWLFGPLNAAREAGPLSLGSWVIGGASILLLALVYAEIGPLVPRSGSIVHMSHIGHGPMLGRLWSWLLFFSYVSVPPVEVMAILTYANNYLPGFLRPRSGLLSSEGFVAAIVLLALVVAMNFLVIRVILLINSAMTWWKLLIPFATIGLLLSRSFHRSNLSVPGLHPTVEGMVQAVGSAGVIFSFFGFRQAIDLAGESRSPGTNIPLAVIGSVLIGGILYVGLQAAFLLSVDPGALVSGGWSGVSFPGVTGPFAALAVSVGAVWWGAVLYADALISPAGAAFIYVTSSARIAMATGETGCAPAFLSRINRQGAPWAGLLLSWGVGVLFFFPFPSWHRLVAYISSVTVLSYCLGPIILLQLRHAIPEASRPFRLRGAGILAPMAFVVSNWIVFWAGLASLTFTLATLSVLLLADLAFRVLPFLARGGTGVGSFIANDLGFKHFYWVIPYFGGLWILSDLGPQSLGGRGVLPFFPAMGILAAGSLGVLRLALRAGVPEGEIARIMEELREVPPSPP